MEKYKLRKSGIEISVVGLGCNNFGAPQAAPLRGRHSAPTEEGKHTVRPKLRREDSRMTVIG